MSSQPGADQCGEASGAASDGDCGCRGYRSWEVESDECCAGPPQCAPDVRHAGVYRRRRGGRTEQHKQRV